AGSTNGPKSRSTVARRAVTQADGDETLHRRRADRAPHAVEIEQVWRRRHLEAAGAADSEARPREGRAQIVAIADEIAPPLIGAEALEPEPGDVEGAGRAEGERGADFAQCPGEHRRGLGDQRADRRAH